MLEDEGTKTEKMLIKEAQTYKNKSDREKSKLLKKVAKMQLDSAVMKKNA